MKNKKISGRYLVLLFSCVGVALIGGVLIGMLLQQMLFFGGAVEIAEGLEGTTFNIEIDLNETLLVDRMTENMEPLIETIKNNCSEDNFIPAKNCTWDKTGENC